MVRSRKKAKVEVEKEKLRIREELKKKGLDVQERLLRLVENLAAEYLASLSLRESSRASCIVPP